MLVARVEVWKYGNPEDVEPLGVLLIANQGHAELGDRDQCEYLVKWQGESRTARLTHYRRRGWKRLLTRALEELA